MVIITAFGAEKVKEMATIDQCLLCLNKLGQWKLFYPMKNV